jgi:antitoxin component of MazEF toxin-antitoxin module
MQLFGKKKEQVTEPVLEEIEFEEDQLFELDLDNVIAGVPEEFAREKLSELDQMMETKEPKEETESKQK